MTVDLRWAILSGLAFVATMATTPYAQEKTKLSKAEVSQYQELHALVDEVIAGKQPAPADVTLKFQNHFVKSTTNVFVPYVLEISGGKLTSFPVAMYVRAVQKSDAPTPAAPTPAATPKSYPFENIYFLADAKGFASSGSSAAQITRALDLAPGQYDVYVAIAETPPKNKASGPGKKAVLVQPLTVPDLSSGLTTSSIILGSEMEEAPGVPTAQQQLERPFTFGGQRITPTFSPTFSKSGEMLFLFLVYNEGTAAGGKPDVTVEFNVFRAAEAKPFSRLAPMAFNATTLPAEFDLSAGHQVMVAQGFPLASFAPGDYKLEIKVTDKTSTQSALRNVPFTVAP